MSEFSCGCQPPTYCPDHKFWCCHNGCSDVGWKHAERECPACFNARIRSVNLDSRATPTRRER